MSEMMHQIRNAPDLGNAGTKNVFGRAAGVSLLAASWGRTQ